MKTKSLVIVIATLLAGVSLRGGGQETQPAPKPEMVLRADRLSDAVLDRVVAGTSADGRRTLRINVGGHVGSTFHYYVIADGQAGTYRAFAVGDNPFQHPRVRAYLQERRLKLQGTPEWSRYAALLEGAVSERPMTTTTDLQTFMSDQQEPPPICQQCQSTCNGSGFSRAITWDPAPVDLTHTDMTLNWSRSDTPFGCRWNATGYQSCWATPEAPLPFPFNTHWYTTSCAKYPIQKSDMFALGESSGSFYNYDFGNPILPTYVTNNAQVVFNGGQVVHGFIFYATGEAYFLLDASVAGASYNNCYF